MRPHPLLAERLNDLAAHRPLAVVVDRHDRFDDALPVWERYLELDSHSTQAAIAKRATALCRMKIKEKPAKTG